MREVLGTEEVLTVTTTIALYPTPEQIQALLSGPADQPVVMVNLLRFKRMAEHPNDNVSGEDGYRRYAEKMIAFVESKGGRVIWSGKVDSQVIGEGGDVFHMVARGVSVAKGVCRNRYGSVRS